MIKESVDPEHVAIPNLSVTNNRAAKYIKAKLMERKGETDKSTIMIGDSNTSLSQQLRETLDRKSTRIYKISTIPSTNKT